MRPLWTLPREASARNGLRPHTIPRPAPTHRLPLRYDANKPHAQVTEHSVVVRGRNFAPTGTGLRVRFGTLGIANATFVSSTQVIMPPPLAQTRHLPHPSLTPTSGGVRAHAACTCACACTSHRLSPPRARAQLRAVTPLSPARVESVSVTVEVTNFGEFVAPPPLANSRPNALRATQQVLFTYYDPRAPPIIYDATPVNGSCGVGGDVVQDTKTGKDVEVSPRDEGYVVTPHPPPPLPHPPPDSHVTRARRLPSSSLRLHPFPHLVRTHTPSWHRLTHTPSRHHLTHTPSTPSTPSPCRHR